MSVDPDLRIALGFILLLRIAVSFTYSSRLSGIGIFAELARDTKLIWIERTLWLLLILPLLAFFVDADGLAWIVYRIRDDAAKHTIMLLPDSFRWLLLVPAVVALLMSIWIRHSAACPAEIDKVVASLRDADPGVMLGRASRIDAATSMRFITGPFRVIRFPQWLADLLLFGPLILATDNWIAVFSYCATCLVWCWLYLPRGEQAWQRLLGDSYVEYAKVSGRLLPKLPRVGEGNGPQYSVPKRFGMSAIIALVTIFAVIFGALDLFQRNLTDIDFTPTLHIYFGSLLMLVWIAQMRFERSGRVASVVVGAILLPICMFFGVDRSASISRTILSGVGLGFLGGVLGYCMGAMAAGIFLLMDWLGPYFPWSRKAAKAANSSDQEGM